MEDDPLMGWGPALVGAGLGGALGAYYGEDAPSAVLGALGGAGTALVGEHEILPRLQKLSALASRGWRDGYLSIFKQAAIGSTMPPANPVAGSAPGAGLQQNQAMPLPMPAPVPQVPKGMAAGGGAGSKMMPMAQPNQASPGMAGMSAGATQASGAKPNAVKPSNNINRNKGVYKSTL